MKGQTIAFIVSGGLPSQDTPPTVRLGSVAYTNLTTGARTSLGALDMISPPAPWTEAFATPTPPDMTLSGGSILWLGQDLTW
jgi:hypothetical protein